MQFRLRHIASVLTAVILPVSLIAQDTAGAMLQSNGVGVLVNRYPAAATTALFPKDLVETQKGTTGRIEITGSTADLGAETMLTFQPEELVLDHGSLSVHTTRGLRVRVGCLLVTPVNPSDWTQYDIVDLDGKVTVKANQKDVYIDAQSKNPQDIKHPEQSKRDIVKEGEQKSREEKCGGAYLNGPTLPGLGAALNSPYVLWPAVGVVVGITCWAVCRPDNPASPSAP